MISIIIIILPYAIVAERRFVFTSIYLECFLKIYKNKKTKASNE